MTLFLDSFIHSTPVLPITATVELACHTFSAYYPQKFCSLPIVDDVGHVIALITYADAMTQQPLNQQMLVLDVAIKSPITVQKEWDVPYIAEYVSERVAPAYAADIVVVDQSHYVGLLRFQDVVLLLSSCFKQNHHQLSHAIHELKKSQGHLVHTEKMAALGQMVAGFAHEINTPLAYIRNNFLMVEEIYSETAQTLRQYRTLTDVLTNSTVTVDEVVRHVADIAVNMPREDNFIQALEHTKQLIQDSIDGLDQMGSMVQSLKGFSRLDAAQVEKVSLNECVQQTLTIVQPSLKATTIIYTDLSELPLVRCSPHQINQVLLNLVQNADAATGDNGKILIKSWCDAHYVYVSVQDNGTGIPDDIKDKIFDPFFTTKAVGEGTGLGLYICYQIMQEHQGTLKFVSKQGQGTRFAIMLPIPALE